MTDNELLRAFVDRQDERAFGAIVERYLRLVYAAARRQVGGDSHTAEDVAQAVFIILARKAPTLLRDRGGGGGEGGPGAGETVLAGWLVQTARLVARTATRSEARRRRREQKIADMTPTSAGQTDELHLLLKVDENLDAALARLSDADRTAVTLRYLQGLSMREVAEQMGTSEAAANKRVTRAVERLRDIFRRKGFMIAPALLTTALLRQAEIALPTEFTTASATTAALQAAKAGASATAAAQLAHAALSVGRTKLAVAVAAALLLLLAIVCGAVMAYLKLTDTAPHQLAVMPSSSPIAIQSAPAPSTAPATLAPTTTTTPPAIKVGVYVSLNSASNLKKLIDGKRNWQSQFRIVDELHDPHLDVVPIIEAGSDRDAELAAILAKTFPGKAPLDVASPGELRQVQVIVVASVCYPTEQALSSVEAAVRGGTGLIVRQCLGGDANGYARPIVRNLRLLDQADADAINAIGVSRAIVVGSHPLLGRLSGQTNRAVRLRAFGGHGSLLPGTTPLLLVRNTANVVYDHDKSPIIPTPGYVICPLSVGQLGEGRVVNAGFTGGPVPVDLDLATDGQFMLRAIRWAARQPVE